MVAIILLPLDLNVVEVIEEEEEVFVVLGPRVKTVDSVTLVVASFFGGERWLLSILYYYFLNPMVNFDNIETRKGFSVPTVKVIQKQFENHLSWLVSVGL